MKATSSLFSRKVSKLDRILEGRIVRNFGRVMIRRNGVWTNYSR